jgi:uncharacterized protein YdeI (YjbR/CyaY-like superfamily)
MNPKIDAFLKRTRSWQPEFRRLREIILACGLTEELKWGWPCYAFEGKNVVLMHGFKEYCAVLFMKGALMKDPKHILIQQTENVQSARQVRLKSVREIDALEKTLKAYIREAIAVEKSGQKVELKKTADYKVPAEFQARLDESAKLKKAFHALTPGRQRGYLFFFSGAKQAKTREARIEKFIPKILAGKGMDD